MSVKMSDPKYKSLDAVNCYLDGFHMNSSSMIANLDTSVKVCSLNSNLVLPVTINQAEYDNSYVCSPYTALVPYCLQELGKLNNKILERVIKWLILWVDKYLKKGHINRVVHINNWMLSTNIYPNKLTLDCNQCFIDTFSQSYRHHAIIFRSLNHFSNTSLMASLKNLGCLMVPFRQVYIYDKSLKDYSKTHNYKIDKKLLENTPYDYVDQNSIKPADYKRIVELYNMLYLDKYSQHNPHFTEKYIKIIIKHPCFFVEGFRNEHGVLDAVGVRFTLENTITLPIVGYDTSKPIKLGLYRLVLISTLLSAERKGCVFNASSGAPDFKRLRGGMPYIEYSAVYINHLSIKNKYMWKLLVSLINKIFIPIMRKYQL